MASFYEKHDIAVCPDGDKVRSDDEGLFCIIDAARVPVRLVNNETVLDFPVVVAVVPAVPAVVPAKSKKKGEVTTIELPPEASTVIEDAN